MRFEDKKFCKISTLADRWDCSPRRIYLLIERGILTPFHPEGCVRKKGMMISVASILNAEVSGILDIEEKFK